MTPAPQFTEVVALIRQAQHRALQRVNHELITLYWQVGEYISQKVAKSEWGSNTVDQLADHLALQHPDLKGFTSRSLYRMKQFYETYLPVHEIVSTLLTQISWTHHLMILSQCKTIEERQFYMLMTIQEKYSSRELKRQLDSGLFQRTMLANAQLPELIRRLNTANVFRDTYVFEFLHASLARQAPARTKTRRTLRPSQPRQSIAKKPRFKNRGSKATLCDFCGENSSSEVPRSTFDKTTTTDMTEQLHVPAARPDMPIIENRVFVIRGQRVMLDAHLAELYGVETKVLNQAVKRNIDRFPDDFMFQLTDDETNLLRSQIVTSKKDNRGGSRTLPYAFTELGIAMLSSVLRSTRAITANMNIMRAFVAMRQHATQYSELKEQLDQLAQRTGERFDEIFKMLDYLYSPQGQRTPIGFQQANA